MGLLDDIKQEYKKDSYEGTIAALIKDEVEAIDGYENAKEVLLRANISSDVYDRAVKVFDHIIEEEKEHIEELKELL